MLNILNVFFVLCLAAPLFFFSELERWQKLGYIIGAAIWLINLLLIGNGVVLLIAYIVLAASCARLVVEHFPIRL